MQPLAPADSYALRYFLSFLWLPKMDVTDISVPSREGAYVNGLNLDGARWNLQVSVPPWFLVTTQPTKWFPCDFMSLGDVSCEGWLPKPSNIVFRCFSCRVALSGVNRLSQRGLQVEDANMGYAWVPAFSTLCGRSLCRPIELGLYQETVDYAFTLLNGGDAEMRWDRLPYS